MKHLFILLSFLLSGTVLFGQTFDWAIGQGASDWDHTSALTSDASGNVYAIGYFRGTVDFDPSSSTQNLTSNGNRDLFVQKLDPNGNLIWAIAYGGTQSDVGVSVLVDGLGDLVVSGYFEGTVDFNPSGGTAQPLTAVGESDFFVMKLNSNGEFVWIQQFGGTENDLILDLKEGPSGGLFATGIFRGTTDFDPSSATNNLSSNGNYDAFVARLTANGDLVWVESFGGTGNEFAEALALDPQGNIYVATEFSNTVDFDPSPSGTTNLTSTGGQDCSILKLDGTGGFVWARSWGSPFYDLVNDLVIGTDGGVYSTGYFSTDADFDPDPVDTFTLMQNGNGDVYVHKLDSAGDFQWAVSTGGATEDESYAIAADAYGNVYATGYFNGSPDFDPSLASRILTSNGGDDIYIWKLNANGGLADALNMGGNANEIGHAIAIDGSNNILLGGIFRSTADFDPSPGVSNLSSNGNADAFVMKLTQSIPLAAAQVLLHASLETNGTIALNWSSNVQADRFSLERSANGWHWESLSEVEALASTSSYQHQDLQPLQGANLYRVRQLDVQGETSFSNQVAVLRGGFASNALNCYPNPAQDRVTVVGDAAALEQLVCFGPRGEDLSQMVRVVSSVNGKVELDLSQLPQGTYMLKAAGATSRIVKL